ncbi:DUF4349 domain-containing protein [uncultured Flavobacterium sp.]|uniref:DUF4349 domain-containing protein n=1 Tax=uncultured Flavobacterium sp. TaxID=165435 RepID=UPI0025D0C460|nr:DUF4349 domain-containing protein [uncultured Flavobacterium sp.]
MKLQKIFYVILLSASLFSCKQSERSEEAMSESAEVSSKDAKTVSSSAAVVDKNSNRKFIRTADLRFKVKNVAQSTYSIENTVAKFGGFVTSTELKSNVVNTSQAKKSSDSIVETTRFIVENNMVIRVPNTLLDTTLKTIARQIDYLDYRIIKADDVSLSLLSNDLSQKRNQQNQARVEDAIQNRGKKLGETVDAEDRVYDSQTQADEARINNLSLKDQVNFSTVSLSLYQNEAIKRETIANSESEEFRTSIGVRLLDGLKTGWHILEEIIVFIVHLWAFILIGFAGWFIYKKTRKKSNL